MGGMTQSIREIVEAQVADKIAKGEALASAIEAAARIEAEARLANREVAKERRAALRAGWTESELKQLGLVGKRPARPAVRTGHDHEQ